MRFLLAVLACALTLTVGAQRYSFINYTVQDGLSQSQVRDICQDQQGYLWIATNSGLNRFNGMEFMNYSIDDGLSDNLIRKLYLSERGNLWVATAGGVSKFENHKIKTWDFVDQYRINDISEFQNQMFFASNTGLVSLEEDTFYQVGGEVAKDYYLRSIVNYKDSVLICGSKNGIYTWNGEEFNTLFIPGYDNLNVRSLFLEKDKLYISARDVGLLNYNLSNSETELFELAYTTVSNFTVDQDEIFAITANQGAFLKEADRTLYFNSSNWMENIGLNCVFKDREENFWLGTAGRGLMKFSGTSVVHYLTDDGLGSNIVLSIQEDLDGNFVFGTWDEGITRLYKDTIYTIEREDGILPDDRVWTMLCDSMNNIWLGTSRGIAILDENNLPLGHPDPEYDEKVRTMVRYDAETVLIGSDHGLSVMKPDTVFHIHPELNILKLYAVNDNVFCGASDTLYKFSGSDNFRTYTIVDSTLGKVNTLTSDFQGNLWVGSEKGLSIKLKDRKMVRFQLDEQNFRSKEVLGLITARDSSIWASGMNGVYRIEYAPERATKYRIYNYGYSEGIIDKEGNQNALFEDSNGYIWIGTASGLVRIDPSSDSLLFDYKIPLLHISNVRLFMEEFNYSDYEIEMDSTFNVPTFIELPHNKNHLTFDFIGINLKDPQSINYEYRLLGVNDEWSPVSKSNYATYSFLQPGEYTFQVRAINKLGDWSDIDEVEILIRPPFWKTWWFIVLVIITIFLIVLYVFQSRIKVIKQRQNNEKLELKNRLLFLEQRSLNASMNRHFIFNSLNSIQYFINSSDKLSANRFLSNFAKLIRKNLDSSAANNFIVTLQEEIERIELYLSLEKMRFSDKFDYTVDVASDIDTEGIEIPSMILQPFVENSIIHGVLSLERKGKIQVKVYKEFGEVVFEVIDNGLGIENSLRSKKNDMIGDHESRGVEITNRRIEILRKLTGENLLIVGPFQMDDDKGNSLGTKVMLKLGGVEKFED